MSNSYTWSVANNQVHVMTVDANENTIVNVGFKVTASDGTHTTAYDGFTRLQHDANTSFTPFESVTQSQVIEWVQAELGEQRIQQIQSSLDKQLNTINNPPARPTRLNGNWS